MYTVHSGVVTAGFQFASGEAVGRAENSSPFAAGTLRMQAPLFKARGLDLEAEVPELFWGTINVLLECELVLDKPDATLSDVDWTAGSAGVQIPPETFSFVRCCVAVEGRYYAGVIYYPHPETKGPTNEHRYEVLEVLTRRIDGLEYGNSVAVICRGDGFTARCKAGSERL